MFLGFKALRFRVQGLRDLDTSQTRQSLRKVPHIPTSHASVWVSSIKFVESAT